MVTPVQLAFGAKDSLGCGCLQVPGLVNVDFADVKAVMVSGGESIMGVGTGSGETLNRQ